MREFAITNGSGVSQLVWNDWSVSYGGTTLGDLHGAQMGADGTVGPRAPVTVSAPAQTRPVIAGSREAGFLVAFLSNDSGEVRVAAQRLDGNGQSLDLEPTILATSTAAIRRIDVAFDGSEWLVVWDDDLGNLRHVFGRRVALDGTVLDPAPVNLLRGERPSVDAAVGTRTFLLVSWDHNQSNEYIRATRVDGATATPLDPPYLTLNTGSGFPDVLGFDDRWLVVWGGVGGIFVDIDGVVGSVFLAASGISETVHGLARSGDTALLTFQRHNSTSANADIHGRRILKDGTLLDSTQGFPICAASNLQFDPRAAFDGTDFRVTWSDYRAHPLLVPGLGDVYQARVTLDGTVPELCGQAVSADLRIPEGDAAVAAVDGLVVVAVPVLHAEAPFGGLRIEIHSSFDTGELGRAYCFGDGSSGPCPCGQIGAERAGCPHSGGVGAGLDAEGSLSSSTDDLVLLGRDLPPGQAALLFHGTTSLQVPFGDGLRCAGGSIRRAGIRFADGTGAAAWGPGLNGSTQWSMGDTRYFQGWFRDPGGPCGSGFNLTQALELVFEP
jgi:hypothetical protein